MREKPAHIVARTTAATTEQPKKKGKTGPKPDYKMPADDSRRQKGKLGSKSGKYKKRYLMSGYYKNSKGDIVVTPMTDIRWQKVIELTANGVKRPEMLKQINITSETLNAYLIKNVGASKQLSEAQLINIRKSWTIDDLEQIFFYIAIGNTVKASAEKMGWDEKRLKSFYQIVRKDKIIKEQYDDARELQAESWLDDIIDIADDSTRDDYRDEKGNLKTNHGVVNRSRLMVDTRKWGMGALNRKRFGDNKHIQHEGKIEVNHAVALASARKRLERAKGTTIEGEATPA